MPSGAVGTLVEQEVLPRLRDAAGIHERADHLLELKRGEMPLRGQERAVAGVVDQARAEAIDGVGAEHVFDVGRDESRIEDVDALASEAGVHREVWSELELVAQPDAAAGASLGPVVEIPGEVGGGERQADPRVEQVGLLEGRHISLQLRARRRLETEPLAGAAEGGAVLDVVPATGQTKDVEVLFVDHDVANEPGV